MKYFLLLSICLSQLCYGQHRFDNDSLFNQFKKDIQIELARHNCIKWDDETKVSFYTLMINCPVDALVKHAHDSTPAVRYNIFIALAVKNVDQKLLSRIVFEHKKDTASYVDCITDLSITRVVNFEMQFALQNREKLPELCTYKERLESIKNSPRIIIPGEYHGLISKDDLLRLDSITYSVEGTRVVSFSLAKDTVSISTDNVFTEEIKEFIKTTKSGESLYLDQIKIEHPDKSIRIVGDKRLQLN